MEAIGQGRLAEIPALVTILWSGGSSDMVPFDRLPWILIVLDSFVPFGQNLQPEKVAPKALVFSGDFSLCMHAPASPSLIGYRTTIAFAIISLLSPLHGDYVAMTYFLFLWAFVYGRGGFFHRGTGAPDILCP